MASPLPRVYPVPDASEQAPAQAAQGYARTVLLVAASDAQRRLTEMALNEHGNGLCRVERAATLAAAARAAAHHSFEAVVIHLEGDRQPAAKSLETLVDLLGETPIVISTERYDPDAATEALALGIQDIFVRGGRGPSRLDRALQHAAARKRAERRFHLLANHDPLTRLPNRELLLDRLTQAIAQAMRQGTMVGLLLLDLDRFKLVNDTLGHDFGDKLLCDAASRIRSCIRDSDTLARLGGDEFMVVLTNITGASDAAKVAAGIVEQFARPLRVEEHEVFVTASVGISLFPGDGTDKNALITNADIAMYRAKEDGRNHYQFYTYGMNATTVERLDLERDLRRAIDRDELLLHYQPQMDIASGKVVGIEALARWQHDDLGLIPPARFIPIAEETGLIAPIGDWVLRAACTQMRDWMDKGAPPLVMSVNLSSRQFHQERLLATVNRVLGDTGLAPGQLGLEITESSLMHDPDDAVVTLCLLHNMGITLSIDDFGTGYSSLGHLKRFPLTALKIDRTFIDDVTSNPEDAAIVRAILAMAHSLRLQVVAEGVETAGQLDFLRDAGCDQIQGYHLSKPLPAQAFAERFLNGAG